MRLPRRPMASSQSPTPKHNCSNDFASPQGEAISFYIRVLLLSSVEFIPKKKRPDSLESGLKEGAVKLETAKPMVLPPRTLAGFRYTPKKKTRFVRIGS